MCNLIDCFKCKVQFEFQEGNPRDAPKKDATGKEIKPEYARDYATNRFICPNSSCKTEQCRSCQASPYHLGMTCKEFKDRALQKYTVCNIENVAIVINQSPKKMLLYQLLRLYQIFAILNNVSSCQEELVIRLQVAGILATASEVKKLAYPA